MVQRIDEPIGLTQPERHAEVNMLGQLRQNVIDSVLDGTGIRHPSSPELLLVQLGPVAI
ncbi:Uncharacterized protein ALO50_04125 [Pseudomonas syringae pv. cerasicola]|uniref:Uncharacterized protein n=1 Tax=Pseudomonas syringae pv. cerasicola TaxID=264451 RepID=A0A0P9QGV8_PSESX|nr:Uncharacterized protein ALO50_04125 [Pseudomonas syringae pv. cerasicola]